MTIRHVRGDLLNQPVEAIVNPWNRNTIPWWLLLPQGVSGAIKKRGGTAPFAELAKHGRMALGEAVATGAGTLPLQAIIHVAALNDFWRSSEEAVALGTRNAITLAAELEIRSLAMPLLGSGTGGLRPNRVKDLMSETLSALSGAMDVTLVEFDRRESLQRDPGA